MTDPATATDTQPQADHPKPENGKSGQASTEAARKGQNPYVGPRAFEEEDSNNFFGRNEETRQLASLVVAHRAVLLYAQSGAGKTSLLQASLNPHLKERKRLKVLPISRVGGDLPPDVDGAAVKNIYVFNTLLNILGQEARPGDVLGLTLSQGLQEQFISEAEDRRRLRPRLLILDQFEELFISHVERQGERTGFFLQLQEALNDFPQLTLLFAMREDYIAYLDFYAAQMPDRLRTRFRMERLGVEAALSAVKEPAARADRPFAEGVAEQLVDDLRRIQLANTRDGLPLAESPLGTYVEPVHLQIVCHQLWANLPPEGDQILASDVQKFGDVDQALIGFYEDALKRAMAKTQLNERRLRTWFDKRLITPARTRGLIFRDEETDETDGLPNAAVDILYEAYIIRASKRGRDTWYELAHDRLVEPILEANRTWEEKRQNPLTLAAEAWKAADEDPKKLYTGDQLKEVQRQLEANPDEFTDLEKEFIAASQEAARIATARRQRLMFFGAIGLIVIFAILSSWALVSRDQANVHREEAESARADADRQRERAETEREKADQQARLADALRLSVQSRNLLDTHPQLSLLLAIEALTGTLRAGEPPVPEAEQVLRDALANMGGLGLSGHAGQVNDVVFSPDNRWLITASADGTARRWDLNDLTAEPASLIGHEGAVNALAISADNKWLFTGSADGTARRWDLSSIKLVEPAANPRQTSADQTPSSVIIANHGEGGSISSLALSPDNNWLATISLNQQSRTGIIKLWDLTAPDPSSLPAKLEGYSGAIINAVAFSADSRWLATAGSDGVVQIWDLTDTVAYPLSLQVHTEAINAIAFSPDGHWLVAGSADGTAILWDLTIADPANLLDVASRVAEDIIFQTQALTSVAGQLSLNEHSGAINAVNISLNSRWLITAGSDGTARMWDLNNVDAEPRAFNHEGEIKRLAFSPDSSWLVTFGDEGSARLWQLNDPTEAPISLKGHEGNILAAVISPDNHWLATAGTDKVVRLWDLTSPANVATAQPITLTGHEGEITALAISPDDLWLASASTDTTIHLWSLQNLTASAIILRGHKDEISTLAISPDNRWLVSGGYDATIRLWDLTKDNPAADPTVLTGHTEPVLALAISQNKLVSGSVDDTARVWDLNEVKADPLKADPQVLSGHLRTIQAVSISPDERWVTTRSRDNTTRLWDLAAVDPTTTSLLLENGPNQNGLALSPNNRWVVTIDSQNNSANLWDLDNPTATPILLQGHTKQIRAVAFDHQGHWLVTGGDDNTVRLWNLDILELIDLACRTAGRNLRPGEWEQYFSQRADIRKTCPKFPEAN